MTDVSASQDDLLCPACAGQRVFDPDLCALTCQSCGTPESLYTSEDRLAAQEFAYCPHEPETEVPEVAEARTHQCETCGGAVTFTGPALSDRCPYCNGPVVLGPQDSGYQSMALIPFAVTKDTADQAARDWVQGRLAAPSNLGQAVEKGRISGLYAPFWTFDSEEAVEYWGKYRVKDGEKTSFRTFRGKMKISFDDLLVPASSHVTPLIRDGILHDFRPESLKPYRAGYLSGFAAERHRQTVAQGLAANADDKRLLIRNRIKRKVNKSGITSLDYRTDTSGIHYRRILVPVWMLHYQYGKKAMKVVVSGIDGRTFGERPFSMIKLAGYSCVLSALAIAIGLIWGAAGFL